MALILAAMKGVTQQVSPHFLPSIPPQSVGGLC